MPRVGEVIVKEPDEDLDYGHNWADPNEPGGIWLEAGDTITTSTWEVPTGLTGHSDSFTTTTTTIWLSGGVVRANPYYVTNTITTSAGRIGVRSLEVRVDFKPPRT